MMYRYKFRAYFVSGLFTPVLLSQAVPVAERIFNSLGRKNYKHVTITINTTRKCLEITLESSIPLAAVNYLMSIQYFSKSLALQPGMGQYIVDGRLLIQ